MTNQPPALEQKIAAALADDGITSADLMALVAEAEAAITVADATANAERTKALDPALSPDPRTARAAMEDAEFAAVRLRKLLPRLQQRLAEVTSAEALAKWQADCERVQVMVAGAAEKFIRYPELVAKLVDILQQAAEVDREVARINSSAPVGAHAWWRAASMPSRAASHRSARLFSCPIGGTAVAWCGRHRGGSTRACSRRCRLAIRARARIDGGRCMRSSDSASENNGSRRWPRPRLVAASSGACRRPPRD